MSAILRLKMSVQSVKSVSDNLGNKTQEEIALLAVYGPDGSANKQWSKWTPTGSLNFTVSNPEAFDKIRPGQFIFVDLSVTEKDSI